MKDRARFWDTLVSSILSMTRDDAREYINEKYGLSYTRETWNKFSGVFSTFLRRFGEPDEILQLTKVTPGGKYYTKKSTAKTPDPKKGIIKEWRTNPYGGAWVKYVADGFDFDEMDSLIKEAISEIDVPVIKQPDNFTSVKDEAIIAVFSDAHVAMETDEDGTALYGGVWNEETFLSRMKDFAHDIAVNSQGRPVYVFDLGDYMDGWDGFTVRGGHKLPQNMKTPKAFKVGVKGKLVLPNMLDSLDVNYLSLTNDNHSGDLAKIVNHTVKLLVGDNCRAFDRFMDHVIIGNHCFIMSHGKDDKYMRSGFPAIPNDKARKAINDYIHFHNLSRYFITFMKGDTHVKLFDDSNQKFRYYNYPALSPASEYVQTNFGLGRSGYVIHSIKYDNPEIKTLVSKEYKWQRKS